MLGSLYVNSRGFINLKPQRRKIDQRIVDAPAGYELVTEDGKPDRYKKKGDTSANPSLISLSQARASKTPGVTTQQQVVRQGRGDGGTMVTVSRNTRTRSSNWGGGADR